MEMEFVLIINTVAAFLTSILSAVVGMAGGVTLLAVMLLTMPITMVVPIHGAIQLVSNTTRFIIYREHIAWPVVGQFALGAVPFAFVGIQLVGMADPVHLKIAIGCFILFAVYVPKKMLTVLAHPKYAFPIAGSIGSALGMIVGASGPLIAPFFLGKDLPKESIIATKATCQGIIHSMKLLLFGLVLSFNFAEHGLMIIFMVCAVVVGTWAGKKILTKYVSEEAFTLLYKSFLTLIAVKILLYDGLYVGWFMTAMAG